MISPDLKKRVLPGVILAGLLFVLLLAAHWSCDGRYVLILVAAVVTGICAAEFAWMTQSTFAAERRRGKIKALIYFTAVMLPCLSVLFGAALDVGCGTSGGPRDAGYVLARSLVASFSVAAVLLVARAPALLEDARLVADDLFLAIYHIGIGGAALTWLAAAPYGPQQLAWLFVITAATDTSAYFGGGRLRGPKLAPIISPNKTISGGICGLGGGALAGIIAGFAFGISGGFVPLLVMALAVSLAGQVGDLMKSYLKRIYGVKDSGRLIPGHGGLYDRLDAALFAAPVVLLWM